MRTGPYRAFVNKNPEFHKKNRMRINRFYSAVLRMLNSWKESGPRTPTDQAVYDMLYKHSDLSSIKREERLPANMRALHSVLTCGEHDHYCHNKSLCPECLSFWRYWVAKSMQEAHKINPRIHVIERQETILMPRGTYQDQYDDNELKLLIGRRINPVDELPTGSKWSKQGIWRFIEEDDRGEYTQDPEATTECYWDAFANTWNAIAGDDIVEDVAAYKLYENWSDEEKEDSKRFRKRQTEVWKKNIKKGVSSLLVNPLLVELQAHWNRLNKLGQDTMGAVHRIIMVPSLLNRSTIMLRLDSLFLDTRDNYNYLKNRYNEFCSQKHFEVIDWPGQPRGRQVWHPRSKVVTVCKPIHDNVMDSLKFVESRFPCSCYLYPNLLEEEFPFYMNCFAERAMTGMTGFFRDECD